MCLLALCAILASCKKSEKNIALIVPIDHAAIADIQEGFVSALKASHPDCCVDVKNAMGDPSMMQSILRTTAAQNVEYVATVGVSTTTAAQKLCTNSTIVGLAAYKDLANASTYIVEDEVGPVMLRDSIQHVFPHVKKITLVHAQDDKITQEAAAIEKLMKDGGIEVQMLSVLRTNDLQTVCQHIQGELVLILKDHTVVAGVQVLLKHTHEKSIPLVASDEGSVKQGATYALGVSERDIGVKSAEIVAALMGKNSSIPKVTKLSPMYIVSDQTPQELLERMQHDKLHKVERTGHVRS